MQVMNEVFVDGTEEGISRRWFYSPDANLFIWYADSGEIEQFQFCYRNSGMEHVVKWTRMEGVRHSQVDNSRGSSPCSPLLVSAVPSDNAAAAILRRRGMGLEPAVYEFVRARIG